MHHYNALGQDLPLQSPVENQARPWVPSPDDGWAPASKGEIVRYPAPAKRRPLILVGGFAANGLCQQDPDGLVGKQIWPPFHFDPESGEWRLHGIAELNQENPIPTGLLIGQYEPLLWFLQQEMQYRMGRDLFVFPYLWTQSNLTSGRRLAGFIESLGPQPEGVDVISHSMGGLVTRVAGLFFAAPLVRVVYLACPFFGAGKSYFNLHPSHSVQLVDNMLVNRILDRLTGEGGALWGNSTALSECFQRMESVWELLPDRIGFERGLSPVGARRPLQDWREVYLNDGATAFPECWHDQICQAMDLKERLGEGMPGRHSLTLYSANHPTVGRVDLTLELSRFAFFGIPYDAAGGGDGSVPAASGRGPGPALEVHGRHLALPNHRTTFYWIARFLGTTD